MKKIIIGTAGHIDHGKTTLIKALTGVDTDRLAEEKRRGISIDLGFTQFKLPSGVIIGIVDVPGHEKFVKNMLAGATGIDLLLLVVATDDGVMPQTREHLAIAGILNVKRAIVALTKADLVDPAWLDMVRSEVVKFLCGTNFEGSPIIAVSSVSGLGLNELVGEIEGVVGEIEERDSSGRIRLPIDRVFTIKGAGTVVTGTLWSGRIGLEDQLVILPRGLSVRVRGLNVHNRRVKEAFAGQRVAVNLAGVDPSRLSRGDTLLEAGYLKETDLFDAKFHLLADAVKPLKNGSRVRIYHGTREVLARIKLLEPGEIAPSSGGLVRFELESPLVLKLGDRYIVRRYSPVHTIGGGSVLDPAPKRGRRLKTALLARLKVIEGGEAKAIIEVILRESNGPLGKKDIMAEGDILEGDLEVALTLLEKKGKVTRIAGDKGPLYLTSAMYNETRERVASALRDFHTKNPLSAGMKREALKVEAMAGFGSKEADAFLTELKERAAVVLSGDVVKDALVKEALDESSEEKMEEVFFLIKDGGLAPPTLSELEGASKAMAAELKEYLRILTSAGRVVRIRHDLFYEADSLSMIEAGLIAHLKEHGRVGPADFREIFGISRKYILPLLEFFDAKKLTKRVGNDRILR
ncbi:MAG: selenocysteine-specific translation elongation factor [Actinomycetota bacterium]|nr:selenocysteine-specific translation elongation factor [Actinomycetota bacterium]